VESKSGRAWICSCGNGNQDRHMTRTFTIGHSLAKMELSSDGKFRVVWSPHMPRPGTLSPSERQHYNSARNDLVNSMRDELAANDRVLTACCEAIWSEAP
jgi:hypothetical protein